MELMSPATSKALQRLCAKLASRGHLDAVERIACHHGVTLQDVFTLAPVAKLACRDIARLLYRRGVPTVTICDWFGAELAEARKLLIADKDQRRRIDAAIGGLS